METSTQEYNCWRAVIDTLREIDETLLKGEKAVIFVALLLMVFGVFTESVLRGLFDHGLPGVSEGARFLMVAVGFLGASVATAEKKHLVVDILAKVFEDRKRVVALLSGLAYFASLLLIGFLLWASSVYMDSPGVQGRVSNALGMPLEYAVSVMPIALGVMALRFSLVSLEEFSIALGWLPVSYRRESEGLASLTKDVE